MLFFHVETTSGLGTVAHVHVLRGLPGCTWLESTALKTKKYMCTVQCTFKLEHGISDRLLIFVVNQINDVRICCMEQPSKCDFPSVDETYDLN